MMKFDHMKDTHTRTWQISFNDLLTILLTFFILLVSVSDINMNKVQELSLSAEDVFRSEIKNEDPQKTLIRAINTLNGVSAHPINGGVSIMLPDFLLYESGSADIINKDMLKSLGQKLQSAAGSIRVEGHTDSIPVANKTFPSNWELSAQRAVNTVKFLVNDCGFDPRNLSAAGYADSRPIASNDIPEGRALNRRVNMIVSLK